MKYSKLLAFLLAPFFLYVGGDGGGGADDRGDNVTEETAEEIQAKADAQAEIDRIAAEKTAKEAADKLAAEKAEADKGKTDEEKAAEKVAEEEEKKRKDTRIPLSRHEAVLKKEREAREVVEAELAKFKGGQEVAKVNEKIAETETKLAELDEKYTKLVTDGSLKEAAAVMKEIRALDRAISDQKADAKAAIAETRAYERVRYDTVCDRLEAAYPVLNPDHADYDKAQVAEVMELKEAYEAKGLAGSAALQKAVGIIMRPATKQQEKAVEGDPKLKAEELEKARKAEALKRNVDASIKQPANKEKVGVDSDKLGGGLNTNVMKLSQTEFAKLDEATLSKLRGDTL